MAVEAATNIAVSNLVYSMECTPDIGAIEALEEIL